MKLTIAELATILAALRDFQEVPMEDRIEEHDDSEGQPLTDAQIDDLCERLILETKIQSNATDGDGFRCLECRSCCGSLHLRQCRLTGEVRQWHCRAVQA